MMLQILYLWPMLVWSVGGSVCDGELCSRNVAPRIAGGDRSEQNGRPFMVALYMRVGTTGDMGFCGGALVSPEWVITAAHCCFHNGEEVNHVQAILGAHSLYDRYEHGRRVVNVAELVIHPDYDPETFANDIALLRLANTIQLSDMITTIQLPYRNISTFNFAGAGATVSGWGIAAEGVTFISPTLREKRMTVLTDTFCNTTYFNQLPDTTICTFHGAAGTCKGDNGGPLTIFYNATEEDILVGVTSFISTTGCNDDQPSVFTRVQRYLDWISELTGVPILY
ncbi:brachyurin-like [Spodoptera frugiperda]|uniref:Brachyurin-like n=1 Tax=Spodoptera frugiperda TaxID=7108 RepID=A0A9R0EJ66_SPOFR|nr:brachyurin-like [Spodoptera frugiperda]